jgi:outer membrane protein OmpA-like peptidoglycan-associated protein
LGKFIHEYGEDSDMRIQNAGLLLLLAGAMVYAGCATPGKGTAIGAGAGAAVGAGVGALIGSGSGEAGKGALIGAAAGAVVGGVIGNILDAQAEELKKVADAKRTEEGILVNFKSDILFDTGKATLKPDAVDQLGKVGAILAKYPQDKIVVVGHTDNVGGDKLNQTLSENRAKAVKVELLGQGVADASISTIGMGKSQPTVSNETSAGRAKNRRVIMKITIPETKS